MSASNKVWVNGSLPDIDDVDLNGFNDENINLIVGSNQTASAADLQQTHKAVARYASYGNVLTASGTGDAIVLSLVGNNIMPATLNGMEVRWQATAVNTGSVTINVPGVGVKNLQNSIGNTLALGDLLNNTFYAAVYNLSVDEWWLVNPVITAITAQTFITAGAATWTKPAGVTQIIIEAVGAGGGGGSADINDTGGGGGGAGGFTRRTLDVTAIASLSITVGAKGNGAPAGGTASTGVNGGSTSVTGTSPNLFMEGGKGGGPGGSAFTATDGRGGTSSGGDLSINGGDGNSSSNSNAFGALGGSSFFGGGGQGRNDNGPGGTSGVNGSGGGGGSSVSSVANAQAGGDGSVGMVTITEYRT